MYKDSKALICYSGNIRNSKEHLVQNGRTLCGVRLKEPIVIIKSINTEELFLLRQSDCGKCYEKATRR